MNLELLKLYKSIANFYFDMQKPAFFHVNHIQILWVTEKKMERES